MRSNVRIAVRVTHAGASCGGDGRRFGVASGAKIPGVRACGDIRRGPPWRRLSGREEAEADETDHADLAGPRVSAPAVHLYARAVCRAAVPRARAYCAAVPEDTRRIIRAILCSECTDTHPAADLTELASRSLTEPAKPDDPVDDDDIAAVAAALRRGRRWLDRPSFKVEDIRARLNHGRTWILTRARGLRQFGRACCPGCHTTNMVTSGRAQPPSNELRFAVNATTRVARRDR